MGTKTNPGKIDAYAAALPDEPLFTLLARDPLAAEMVRIWAALRLGDVVMATYAFNRLAELYGRDLYSRAPDWYRGESAVHVSTDMLNWRAANHGIWRKPIQADAA